MIKKLLSIFKKKEVVNEAPKQKKSMGELLIEAEENMSPEEYLAYELSKSKSIQSVYDRSFQVKEVTFYHPKNSQHFAMDADCVPNSIAIPTFNSQSGINFALLSWYASSGFIGYQNCAILAQHWLIEKCCSMPAKDALRKGYEITINNGEEVEPDIQAELKRLDKKYQLNKNLLEFVTKGRMFGIRIAYFEIESPDPDFYEKPFNIDGVLPGSFKGIVQVDPVWTAGQPDMDAAGNPNSRYFYEPTWWMVSGRRIHRTHIVIYRCGELPDTLKPTYYYGSVSIPQKIYERVYNMERTANEAPLLCLTKRTQVLKTSLAQGVAQNQQLFQRIENQVALKNNYGMSVIDNEDEMQQFDISLADLDNVIMTQAQLVCAAAEIPATKLLGTQPKGFNSSGEYEESNYHETLESIQCHDLTPLCERYYQVVIKSDIIPMFHVEQFEIDINWVPLDALTEEEEANINKTKADTAAVLSGTGAVDGLDIRKKLVLDKDSGFNGLDMELPEEPEDDNLEIDEPALEEEPVR